MYYINNFICRDQVLTQFWLCVEFMTVAFTTIGSVYCGWTDVVVFEETRVGDVVTGVKATGAVETGEVTIGAVVTWVVETGETTTDVVVIT